MRDAVAAAIPFGLLLVGAAARGQAPPAAVGAPPVSTPLPAAAPLVRISLADAVRDAQRRHPSLAVAAATVRRAEAMVLEARAAARPVVTGSAAYTHLDSKRVFNGNTIAGQEQLAANVQVVVPLIAPAAWGQRWIAEEAGTVAGANARDLLRLVSVAAARAWLAVVAQRRVLEANVSALETARAHHTYARTRLEGGVGRAIDEVRAAQEVAAGESQTEAAEAALARAREALGLVTAADGPLDADDRFDLAATPALADALAGARRERTDVALAATRLKLAEKRRGELWTYYAPYLAAIGQPFLQVPHTLTTPNLGWQVQLVLALPLWDGGLRGGVERERDSTIEETRAGLEGAVRQAESEVRSAFAVLLRVDRSLDAARRAAELAGKAVDIANVAWQAGATTSLEVIDAQRRAKDAQIGAAVAEDAARQARLDLLVASGKFP